MNLSAKAKQAAAGILAVSTVMWSMAMFAVPVAVAAAHPSGCLVNASGTVYLISGGKKHGFTSAEVFMSHGYNFGQVVTANSDDTSLPTGPIKIYADGTLVKGPNDPLVYLVVNSQKRGFTSGSVFTGLGYSFANIQWAPVNTFNDIPTGSNIDSTSITGLPMSGPGPQTVTCGNNDDDDGGPLDGGAGDITISALSTFGDEEVGEGDSDVEVLAFEVEADDGSDVRITSVKVELAQQTAADSEDLADYATEVSVWMDGDMVGSSDVDGFTESNDVFSRSIQLSNAVVRAGEEAEFTLAVTADDNLDSGDIDTDDWQIGVSSVRFLDAEGVTTTESLTLDVADDTLDDTLEEEFDFASFAAASNVELKVALDEDEDDTNDAHVVDIDDTDDTDDVEVLAFTIEADGDSDLNIQEIPAVITTTGETDEAVLVQNAQLWHNGSSIANDTIPTGGAVTFEDLDVDVEAGDMEHFVITVDVQDTTGAADNGDTVQASLTTGNVDDIEAEDEVGEEVGDTDASGSAVGGTHAVYDSGIMVEFVDSSATRTFTADASGEDDQGTYEITFEVTAFDGDMRIDTSSEVDGASTASGAYTLADAACVAAETYTATINGTAVVYTALVGDCSGADSADTLAIMTGLATAIDANVTVGPLVNASVSDGAGTTTINLVAVSSGSAGNYTTTASDTSVAGTLVASQAAMTGGVDDNVAGQGVEFSEVDTAGTPTLSSKILESDETDTEDTANTFEVDENTTREFTLTVIYTADTTPTDGSVYVKINSINWGTATDNSNANYYEFDLGDFKTQYLFLNGIA